MALKKIDLCINQLNVDIVYFDYLKFYGESNDSLPEFKHSSGTNEFSRISSRELARKPNFAWARVVKKDFYCAIRFPIGFIYEDVLTSPLLCTKTDKIGYISHHYMDIGKEKTLSQQVRQKNNSDYLRRCLFSKKEFHKKIIITNIIQPLL